MTHEPRNGRTVTLDFETYYDTEYSLRRLTYIEYINDSRFKVHGASVAIDDACPVWMPERELESFIKENNWQNSALLGHNLMFDGAILAWVYGVVPKLYIDTLPMARFVIGSKSKSHSLASAHEFLTGQPAKLGSVALADVKGVVNPSAEQMVNLARYAVDDARETRRIFDLMRPCFPRTEYEQVDWTIRMFTQPRLHLDKNILRQVITYQQEHKHDSLSAAGVQKADVMSNIKLADLLRARGIDPPMKISKTTGKEAFAFAKSDKEFARLVESDDPVLRDIVRARLANKTTIEETRAKRFLDVADKMQGLMPVALQYCGALQTNRQSGTQKLNQQNMGRKSQLRMAVTAPPKHVIVVADLAGIELRVNMLQIGQLDVVEDIRAGVDLYCKSAAALFGRPVTKAQADDRFIGKVMELSLGYFAGHTAFRNMLWDQAQRDESEEFCRAAVGVYRSSKPRLGEMSKQFTSMLAHMAAGHKPHNPYNSPVEVLSDGIIMPGGFKISYPDIRFEPEVIKEGVSIRRAGYSFVRRGKMWPQGRDMIGAPGLLENPSQGLARCVLADMQARIKRQTGESPVLQVHDELVFVAREAEAEDLLVAVLKEMHQAPDFWPDLPVKAEGAIAYRYGEAK